MVIKPAMRFYVTNLVEKALLLIVKLHVLNQPDHDQRMSQLYQTFCQVLPHGHCQLSHSKFLFQSYAQTTISKKNLSFCPGQKNHM